MWLSTVRGAEVLQAPGSTHLLITHKSILRALLCVALRLTPTSFRAIDAHNGSVSVFRRAPCPLLRSLGFGSEDGCWLHLGDTISVFHPLSWGVEHLHGH